MRLLFSCQPSIANLDEFRVLQEARSSEDISASHLFASNPSASEKVLTALNVRHPQPLRIPLGELTPDDVRTIVVEYLREYCHELDREHLENLCAIPQARNPLYLTVMLHELRTLGGNDLNTLVPARIAAMPQDYPDTVSLFAWVLQRMEEAEGFGKEAVQAWCLYLALGRVGMASRELADLLGLKLGPEAVRTALRIERALRHYLQRRGEQWDFFHGQLREAVMERCGGEQRIVRGHRYIAFYFRLLADPARDFQWKGASHRAFLEVACHLGGAGTWGVGELTKIMCDVRFIQTRCTFGQVIPLLADYGLAERCLCNSDAKDAVFDAFKAAITKEAEFLDQHPRWVWQQLYNRLRFQLGAICQAIEAEKQRCGLKGVPHIELRSPVSEATGLLTTFQAHKALVWNCLFSTDGKVFASIGMDGAVRIWESDTFRAIATLRHNAFEAPGYAERAEEVLLGDSGGSTVWKKSIMKQVRRCANDVIDCAFDSSSATLITRLGDETLVAWDIYSGRPRWVSSCFDEFLANVEIDDDGVATSVATSRSATAMAVDTEHNMVLSPRLEHLLALDLRDGSLLGDWHTNASDIHVTDSPHGNFIVAERNSPSRVFIIEPRTAAITELFEEEELASCTGSPGLSLIIIGDQKGRIVVRDAVTTRVIATRQAHDESISQCSTSPDGRYLITTSGETVKLWLLPMLEEHETLKVLFSPVVVSPDSKLIAGRSAHRSFELTVWDLATGRETARLVGHGGNPRCCAFSPDGSRIVSGDDAGAIRVWDAMHSEAPPRLAVHQSFIRSCEFSADGKKLATSDDDGCLQIWNANTLACETRLEHSASSRWAIGPDGAILVSVGHGVITLWDTPSSRELATLEVPDTRSFQSHCAIAPDGKIAAITFDDTLVIWNLQTRTTNIADRDSHVYSPRCVFTPDARWLVTTEHYSLAVRSAASGARVGNTFNPANQTKRLSTFAISPAGDVVVTGDEDGRLQVWQWPPDQASAMAFPDLLLLREIPDPSETEIVSCSVGAGGRLVASANKMGIVRITDALDGAELGVIPVQAVSCVALHPVRPLLVIGTHSGCILLADLCCMPAGLHFGSLDTDYSFLRLNPDSSAVVRAVPPAPQPEFQEWTTRFFAALSVFEEQQRETGATNTIPIPKLDEPSADHAVRDHTPLLDVTFPWANDDRLTGAAVIGGQHLSNHDEFPEADMLPDDILPLHLLFSEAAESAPASLSDADAPLESATAHLKVGNPQQALDLLRPLLFPNDYPEMKQDSPLELRVAFLHALMQAQNVDSLETHLRNIPEQDDPRIRAITAALASWRGSFSFRQKLGFARPPLPPPPI